MFEKVYVLILAVLIASITAPTATYATDLHAEQDYVFVVNQTACNLTGDMYFGNLSAALNFSTTLSYSHITIYVCGGFYNNTFADNYSLSNIDIIGYGGPVINMSNALVFVNASNIVVNGIIMIGPAGDYQLVFLNVSGIEISSVSFEEAYGAIYIETGSGIMINDITINQTHEYGVVIFDSRYIDSRDVKGSLAVSGGVIPEDKGWSNTGDNSLRLLRGINIKSPLSIGFYIENSSYITISDINITAVDIGIYTYGVEYITIYNVSIIPSFIGIYFDTTNYGNISSASIYGSYIFYTYGIYVHNSSLIDMHSVFTQAIYMAVTFDTSSDGLIDNHLSFYDYYGEYIYSSENISIAHVTGIMDIYGILLSGSSDVSILDSLLLWPLEMGISITASNILVKDTVVATSPYNGTGIGVDGRGVGNITVKDTVVEGFINGIFIGYAYNVLIDNVTVRNCISGIVNDNGGGIVINNSLIADNHVGIRTPPYSVNMTNLEIKDNIVGVNVIEPEYSVVGTTLFFADSIIANNSYLGIVIAMNISYTTLSSPMILENLNIVDNGEAGNSSTAGLFISAYAYGYPDPDLAPDLVSILHCRIVDNKYYGIVFNYSRYIGMHFTGIRNNYIGLMAEHSDYLRLSNNVIVDNEVDDVATYSSNITIRGSVMGSSINEKLTIQFYGDTRLSDITGDEAVDLFGYLPAGARVLVVIFNITVDAGSWAYVRYEYTDSFLYSKDTTENLLRLAYFNPVSNEWITISPTGQDKVANYIAYNVTGGTVYIIYGFPDPSVGGVIAELNSIVNANMLLVMLGIVLALSFLAKIIKKK